MDIKRVRPYLLLAECLFTAALEADTHPLVLCLGQLFLHAFKFLEDGSAFPVEFSTGGLQVCLFTIQVVLKTL